MRRQTGRHHSAGPSPRTPVSRPGRTLCLRAGRWPPQPALHIGELADLLDTNGMGGELRDPKYQDPAFITANTSHIIDDLVAGFIASLPAEEAYHAAQKRGFTWGAVRPPEALLDDPHLHDRDFWKQVEHPELGRSFTYPGEAAIYNGSPWKISRRAPLIGEHNAEIFCDELGLSRSDLVVMAENRVIWRRRRCFGAQDTLDAVAHVIQVSLTPVFLLSGIATLLNVFSLTRLARVADRVEALSKALDDADPTQAKALAVLLAQLHRRSLALDTAVVLGALGGAATCGAVLALLVSELGKGHPVRGFFFPCSALRLFARLAPSWRSPPKC